ncbi:MAG TPA: glycosyltransferase family 4 protein [Vicinamibacterales bacterium]|nr:glycosyltransferase family 4 protein [Vicinamibacterales bacterium]
MSSPRTSGIRVAIVSQPFDLVYPPDVDSSVPLQTVHLSRELVSRGFQVVVYAPRKNAAVLHANVDGVAYRYLSERGSGFMNRLFAGIFKMLPWRRIPFHASVLSELRYTVELAIRIRAQKAKIIHVHSFTNFVPVIRIVNRRARFVLHMHSEWVCQMDAKIMGRRVAMTHLLVACSTHFADVVRRAFPASAPRLRVLFNGVDTDFFSPAEQPAVSTNRSIRLLFVGRVSPEKGIHDLLEAFSQIASVLPELELDIVGPDASAPRGYIVDASDDPTVRRLAEFYDVEERHGVSYLNQLKQRLSPALSARVRFCGPADRQRVLEHYRRADILINPSLSEMFGGTVAEAMACGVPVVATRVGGMKDTVRHGETGLLVDPARPDELAGAVRRLATDPQLRRTMRQRARERAVALVSWETLGAQLATAYDGLIAASTPERSHEQRPAPTRAPHR